MKKPVVVAIACALFHAKAVAEDPAVETRRGPDAVEVESTRLLRQHTTDPSFLTEWVDYVPESGSVPSPLDFLGYVTGTPGRLTQPEKINEYFRALAAASGRVRVFSMGLSDGGREMIVAAVADEEVLDRLDGIKAANRSLSDPRRTSKEEAEAIARATPVTYWITAGLHSPETGPPEMVMELAYRLAVSEQEHIREIRRNVVTLISPVLEMAGRARMVDWYRRYLTGVTDLEDSPPVMAPYWGDYTAHDNNRDGLQLSQPLTRNYVETYHAFLPAVSLDLHESIPLLYVSTGTGPYNETIDPITVTEWQWLSSWDVSQATALGLRGVWTWGFYDGWYPGYLLWVTNNHNGVGRFYETFGNLNPGTFTRDLKDDTYAKARVNARQWYRPWPPEQEILWSLRNNTNYMQTGVLAALQAAARNRETLLLNFWQKSFNSLNSGRTEPPYAFIIPAAQRDRGNLAHLLWLLDGHRIEVHEAVDATALTESVTLSRGDYVVRMDQPYRNFARTLLMKQEYPKTAEHDPYDDVAWSLDYMLGLDIRPVNETSIQAVAMRALDAVPDLPGTVEEDTRWLVAHEGQTSLASLCFALSDARVRALSRSWRGQPAGSLVIEGIDAGRARLLAAEFHLDFQALGREAPPETIEVDLPRVGLYHTWLYTQDSGWARFTLEQLRIPFALLDKDDFRAGDLAERFDVIIVPDQGGLRLKHLLQEIDRKWSPMPYTQTPEFPSHGTPDASPDITGGMGFEGLENVQRFIEEGGVLVTLGGAGRLVAESGITRDVGVGEPGGTPGSHVTTRILRPEHPVAFGFDETSFVFRRDEPRFGVGEFRQGMVVMQYGTKTMRQAQAEADRKAGIPVDSPPQEPGASGDMDEPKDDAPLFLSGIVRDPEALERQPAVLDVPLGKGRVLLFTWNPLHRHQNLHDVPFLTNALLFYNDLPPTPTAKDMRLREDAAGAAVGR